MEWILFLLEGLHLVEAMVLVVLLILAQEMAVPVVVVVAAVSIVELQLVDHQPKQVITVVQGMDLLVTPVMYHLLTILLVEVALLLMVLLVLLLAPEEVGQVVYPLLQVLQYITQAAVVEAQQHTQAVVRYMDAAAVVPPELQQLVLLPEQAQVGMAALHLVIKDKMVLLTLVVAVGEL